MFPVWLVHKDVPRWIASLALALWSASLFFTGFETYDHKHSLLGLDILAIGWLGVLVLNFAWFANIFVVLAMVKLIRGRTATVSAAIAALLSLQTFSFSAVPLGESGAEAAVYGYGFGALLWLAAIYFIFFAAGLLVSATQARRPGDAASPVITIVAVLPLVLLVCASLYFAVNDRRNANTVERSRLANVAFKRGPVCDVEVAAPRNVFERTSPVEVVKVGTYLPVPFDKPDHLLEWGVSTVWLDGRAYKLDGISGKAAVVEANTDALPRAKLKVLWKTESRQPNDLELTLVSADERVVAFDQAWRNEVQWYYCPDYNRFPEASDNPRKLITDALGITSR